MLLIVHTILSGYFHEPINTSSCYSQVALLAIIDKYGVPISQWIWLTEMSMNKIAQWINICADNWIAKSVTIARNAFKFNSFQFSYSSVRSFEISKQNFSPWWEKINFKYQMLYLISVSIETLFQKLNISWRSIKMLPKKSWLLRSPIWILPVSMLCSISVILRLSGDGNQGMICTGNR